MLFRRFCESEWHMENGDYECWDKEVKTFQLFLHTNQLKVNNKFLSRPCCTCWMVLHGYQQKEKLPVRWRLIRQFWTTNIRAIWGKFSAKKVFMMNGEIDRDRKRNVYLLYRIKNPIGKLCNMVEKESEWETRLEIADGSI